MLQIGMATSCFHVLYLQKIYILRGRVFLILHMHEFSWHFAHLFWIVILSPIFFSSHTYTVLSFSSFHLHFFFLCMYFFILSMQSLSFVQRSSFIFVFSITHIPFCYILYIFFFWHLLVTQKHFSAFTSHSLV